MTRGVRICWLLLLLAGITLALLSPPFSSLDEPAHLLRICAVAEGDLAATRLGDRMGSEIACGWLDLMKTAGPAEPGATFRSALDPELRALSDRLKPSANPARCFVAYPATVGYVPVSYIPPAIAMRLVRWFDGGGIPQLLAARIANLILAWLLIGAALRVAPSIAYSTLALASLPMTVYLLSVHVTDSLLCAAALLLVASVVRSLENRAAVPAIGVGAGILICLLKAPYLPTTLIALVPGGRKGWPRRALAGTLLVVAALSSVLWWQAQRRDSPEIEAPPDGKLQAILESPLGLVELLANDVIVNAAAYRMSFVGVLGRLDAPVDPSLRLVLGLWLMLLLGLESQRVRSSRYVHLVSLALIVASCVAIQLLMYLTWTPPGWEGIRGVQGRYFIPIAPLVLLAIPKLREIDPRIIERAGIGFVPASLAVTIAVIYLRYWG